MTMPQTTLRGPWPKIPKKPQVLTDFNAIKKTRDPYQTSKTREMGKWDKLFQGISEGDCFVMPTEEVARASSALRKWLKTNDIDGLIRQRSKCEDGQGRVWLYKILKK